MSRIRNCRDLSGSKGARKGAYSTEFLTDSSIVVEMSSIYITSLSASAWISILFIVESC